MQIHHDISRQCEKEVATVSTTQSRPPSALPSLDSLFEYAPQSAITCNVKLNIMERSCYGFLNLCMVARSKLAVDVIKQALSARRDHARVYFMSQQF